MIETMIIESGEGLVSKTTEEKIIYNNQGEEIAREVRLSVEFDEYEEVTHGKIPASVCLESKKR